MQNSFINMTFQQKFCLNAKKRLWMPFGGCGCWGNLNWWERWKNLPARVQSKRASQPRGVAENRFYCIIDEVNHLYSSMCFERKQAFRLHPHPARMTPIQVNRPVSTMPGEVRLARHWRDQLQILFAQVELHARYFISTSLRWATNSPAFKTYRYTPLATRAPF